MSDSYPRIIPANHTRQNVGVRTRCSGAAFGWSLCLVDGHEPMVHDVSNLVIHRANFVGRAMAHIPGCPRWVEDPQDRPSFAEFHGHTESNQIHTKSLASTHSHPSTSLIALVGHAEGHWWCLWHLVRFGVFGRRLQLLGLPSNQQILLAYCLTAQDVGPLLEVQSIQQHNSKLTIIPSTHIPPIQTSRPHYGKHTHTQVLLAFTL